MPAAAPLTFAAGRSELFLNFVGTVRAELLSASTMRPLLPLSQPLSGDATLAQVVWPGHSRPLAAFGGANPVRVAARDALRPRRAKLQRGAMRAARGGVGAVGQHDAKQ